MVSAQLLYMSTIPTAPAPTAESLWHRYRRSGDKRLRDRLARLNDRLALKIAHRMSGESPEPIDDLAQLCRIGLLKAVERFDPDKIVEGKRVSFSSFAVPYIRGEVQHFNRDHFSHLKVPRRTFETVGAVKRTQKQMEAMGRTITLDECAIAHGIAKEQWEWMSAAVQRKPLVALEDAMHLSAEDESEETDRKRMRNAVLAQLARLPQLARECVSEKFFSQLTDEQIARRHKLPVAEIQTLIQEALTQLQTQLQEIAPC